MRMAALLPSEKEVEASGFQCRYRRHAANAFSHSTLWRVQLIYPAAGFLLFEDGEKRIERLLTKDTGIVVASIDIEVVDFLHLGFRQLKIEDGQVLPKSLD